MAVSTVFVNSTVHAELRNWLKDNVNAEVAASTRIIYRGKKWQQPEKESFGLFIDFVETFVLREIAGLGSFAGYLLRMGDNVLIVPRWLTALLKGRFDEHCEEQGHNRKHKNLFCLECRACICKDCDDHANHRLLKIFTHGTGRNQSCAVVKLDNTNELLDCSHIQQRPQTSYGGNNCDRDSCDAALEHHNSVCSIDCKVNHIMSAPSNYRSARWLLNRVNLP
ncbi:hypothetical protein WN944_018703 [Citrus x changshan-huyou]|uniref:B box-type domain-containing protein n=1 Tax=Citrus x changshan-huyou TaxID=2935761 RepID=A0AAP0QIS0_9ROSI